MCKTVELFMDTLDGDAWEMTSQAVCTSFTSETPDLASVMSNQVAQNNLWKSLPGSVTGICLLSELYDMRQVGVFLAIIVRIWQGQGEAITWRRLQ